MCDEKRKRSPNWLPSEKKLLLDLVENHFGVVENRKTDGVSIKAKLAEWQIISVKYNSQTTHCHREAENLKSQWENMKKAVKKEASHARMQRIQTGGGPPNPKKDDLIYLRILSLVNTSAIGLYNPYDNDSVVPVHADSETIIATGSESEYLPTICNKDLNKMIDIDQSQPVKNIKICGPTSMDTEVKDCGDYTLVPTPALCTPVSAQLHTNLEEDVTMTACETQNQEFAVKDWGDYTPQLLKTPVSAQLKTAKNKTDISRRRPLHTPVTSTLEMLLKEKIEAINLQKSLAAEEAEGEKDSITFRNRNKKRNSKTRKVKNHTFVVRIKKKKERI